MYHNFFAWPLHFPNVQVIGNDWCVLRDEGTLVLVVEQELSDCIEIDAGSEVGELTFTSNSEYLVGGWKEGVQVWRVKDGERVATMKLGYRVSSIAVSKDGRFIAGGSGQGDVLVWDATTYEQVFAGYNGWLRSVDFSPDSSCLVFANGSAKTATIWESWDMAVAHGKKVRTLDHGEWVLAAKYSPQGDQIATACQEFP